MVIDDNPLYRGLQSWAVFQPFPGNDYFKRGADAAGLAHAKEAFTRAAEGGLRPSQVSTITTLGGNYWHAFNSQQYLIFDMHLDSQAANVYAKHDMLAFYEPRINYFADEYCKGLKYIHINQLIRNSGGEPKKMDFNIPEKMVSCGAFVDITAEDFYNNVLKHDLQGRPRKVFNQLELVATAERKMFDESSAVVRKVRKLLNEVHAANLAAAKAAAKECQMKRMRDLLWDHYQTILQLAQDPDNWWNGVLLINRKSHSALYIYIVRIRDLKVGDDNYWKKEFLIEQGFDFTWMSAAYGGRVYGSDPGVYGSGGEEASKRKAEDAFGESAERESEKPEIWEAGDL